MFSYEKSSEMPCSQQELFDWHKKNSALRRLTPPWMRVNVLQEADSLAKGSEVTLEIKAAPLMKLKLISKHTDYQEGKEFTDTMLKGPFSYWKHRHQMIDNGKESSILQDSVEYTPPLPFSNPLIKSEINRLFNYRHRVLKADLELIKRYDSSCMKIAITGATGLVGSELKHFLRSAGHDVYTLVRTPCKSDKEIRWNPLTGDIELSKLEGFDAIIHLAGENIGSGYWTKKKKQRIRDSRVIGTKHLVAALNNLQNPPKTLISFSAIGFYGVKALETDEDHSSCGNDFLASVCSDWEQEALQYNKGRVVIPRLGVILSPKGGALEKMLLPFKLGFGGKIASGAQYMSWIAIDDVIYNLYHMLCNKTISGTLNLTSPNPVTNEDFSKVLAKVLKRPCLFPVPSIALKALFGEMAEATMLSSIKAFPNTLKGSKAPFFYSELEDALRHLLGK
ncbi:MAG: TIGR01777 family protein [Chlamydiales bacterium]|nr:TIGR01777 family oxidoreductase [Chlamydiales bacterium]NCF71691.1 TIGR01777 family protein [Chlamydiales bacterium]